MSMETLSGSRIPSMVSSGFPNSAIAPSMLMWETVKTVARLRSRANTLLKLGVLMRQLLNQGSTGQWHLYLLVNGRFTSIDFPGAVKRWAVSLGFAGAMLCLAAPLHAGEQVPFKGNFSFTIVLATPIDATHVLFDVDVHVQATHWARPRDRAASFWTWQPLPMWARPPGRRLTETRSSPRLPGSLSPPTHRACLKMLRPSRSWGEQAASKVQLAQASVEGR